MTRTRQQLIGAMADAAEQSVFAEHVTWRDALFAASDRGWDVSRPADPDRALLGVLADEYVHLDEHVATLPQRLHVEWLTDILEVPRLPVVPDRVVAAATIEPKLAPAVIPAGTMLRGGKDAYGNERRYRTIDALTAHGAALVGVRVMVPGGPPAGAPGLAYSAPDFPLVPPQTELQKPFGPPAPHVIRISSANLAFSAGDLTAQFNFVGADEGLIGTLRNSSEWRWPNAFGGMSTALPKPGTGVKVSIPLSDGCVDPAGGVPWIECVIKPTSPLPLALEFTDVKVAVTSRSGLTPDAAFAGEGAVDVSKEFEPFGVTASMGDSFYLRCDEALAKPVTTFSIDVELVHAISGGGPLSSLDLEGAYTFIGGQLVAYSWVHEAVIAGDTPSHTTPIVTLQMEWQRLLAGKWEKFGNTAYTFGDHTGSLASAGSEATTLSGQPGRYVRLNITSGDMGWKAYQRALATFASLAVADPTNSTGMPMPLVPAIYRYLTISYETAESSATRIESRSGWRHDVKVSPSWKPFRVDVDGIGNSGMVAFGLAVPETVTGSSVSLYVDLTSPSPCGVDDLAVPRWESWNGDEWQPLLVADGTNRMRESGLIRFVAPANWAAGCDGVSAATGRWIRFVTNQPIQIGAILAVIPDAVVAEYVSAAPDPASDPSPATALPAGTIKGTLAPIPGVKKVTNLTSVRGRGPETDAGFAVRAAARVRHRGRAITAWDYEQMIAISFPEVAAVRCLPHTDSAGHFAAGSIGLLVIPDFPGALQPRPSVSLASRIRESLAPVMPVRAITSILCPEYVPATVNASIKLRAGIAAITGKAAILAAIDTLLHPTGVLPVRWGESLYASSLVAALERLPFVDAVTAFQLVGPAGPTEVVGVDVCLGLYCSSGLHLVNVEEQL